MSASAIRRKSYKKAQEDSGPFSPIHWEVGGSGTEVPAGKLQVMEKFFTPVQQAKEVKGSSDLTLQDCRCLQPWTERGSDPFSTLSSSSSSSSSSSASSSSASRSSEASLEKETFLLTNPRYHSQSCMDISGEARAFRRGQNKEDALYEAGGTPGPFTRLRKGQSKSADRLSHRQAGRELRPLPGQEDAVDQHLYKATSLERSLVFNEQTEILAPRQPHQSDPPPPSKGILKNGGDQLRKAKSIETITVRSVGREAQPAPRPPRPLQREKEPPSSLDLSAAKKPPATERMKLVEEKIRFSEFLNEITQQVMSPSSLSSLGWRPPGATGAPRAPSSDGSDSKGSSSKASSPGSLLEEKTTQPGRRGRLGQLESKGDISPSCHGQYQSNPTLARTPDGDSTGVGVSPSAHGHTSRGGSPRLLGEGGVKPRKHAEAKMGHLWEAKVQEQTPKRAERLSDLTTEKSTSHKLRDDAAAKNGAHTQEPPAEANVVQPLPLREQDSDPVAQVEEETGLQSRAGQRDLQKTWEELEALKEKFCRLQEDYSKTQRTNQLLEEKLQIIAQNMAEERQTLNQRMNELLDRLTGGPSAVCNFEKINISALVSKSGVKHSRPQKPDSPDSLSSLHILDVAPPPAFMDGASDAQTTTTTTTTPSQSDSATETSKLGGSSESDTAGGPNGEQAPLMEYKALPPPAEGPKRHAKGHTRATAFTPWKQKSTKFSTEPANSTESECSGEETTPLCPLPTPRFLYLRQEAVVAPSGPGSFPLLPAVEPVVFEVVRPPTPTGVAPAAKQLELVPELSSSESSDDIPEVSWSPGLVEKASGTHLDYESAQRILDNLLQKSSEREKGREKEAHKAIRPGGYRLAVHKDGSGPGRSLGAQHRIRYYQDLPSPGEGSPQGKVYQSPTCAVEPPLPRSGAAVSPCNDCAQDSTSL